VYYDEIHEYDYRLDEKLDGELRRLAEQTGRPKSDMVRDALRRKIAITRLDELRKSVAPFAEARGWLTDEDVFRDMS